MSGPFAMRGVIEGFYGTPWTHEQRRRALALLGDRGMTTYFVSTKDEPWQRAEWAAPLSTNVLDGLSELADVARQHGVQLGVSTSPGLTVEYSDPHTADVIVARFASLAERGITLFGLLLDDIPGELQHESDRSAFTDLCSAHVHLVREVAHRLPAGTRLVVCPLCYHGTGDDPCLRRMADALPPDVPLMWTGRQICSAWLSTDDARHLTTTWGSKPLFWDNYPVNDVAMTHELHVGPLRGRDTDLSEWSVGLLANPMSLFEASLLPLLTIADYVSDPARYDADASWERALVDLIPDEVDRDAYRTFARCHLDSCLSEQAAPELEAELSRAMFEWRTGHPAAAARRLRAESARTKQAVDRVDSADFGNQALRREVGPWLAKMRLVCESLDVLAGFVTAEAGLEDLRAAARALSADRARSAGDGVQMTLDEVIALADAGVLDPEAEKIPHPGKKEHHQ